MQKSTRYSRMLLWFGLIIFACASSIAAIAATRYEYQEVAGSIHCVGEHAMDFSCHKRHYQLITEAFGVIAAFKDLHIQYDKNPFVHSQCHQLAHAIGNVAARNAEDISEAFISGDSLCWSGYYHGVVEEFVQMRGKETFIEIADRMCAKIPDKPRYGFDYYNCVHGLGHGVMAITKNQLFDALTLCDNLAGWWEKRSCYGGVFMENIMADNRNHYAAYLKPDDLLYPCNAVDATYKEECYKMQTSYALTKNGHNFADLFTLCTKADKGFERTCAQSIGRDASGQSISDVEKTTATCALALTDEQRADCYYGAAKDFVSYFHSDIQARELCAAAGEQFRLGCENALLEQWHTLVPN
jgi:hypothetical protein